MRKYLYFLCIAVTAMAAGCTMEEAASESAGVVLDGTHMTLSGETHTSTRVTIGEEDGGVFPLLWSSGDQISISSKDASVRGAFSGELADLYSESIGSASGVFQTRNALSPSSDMDLVILYPSTLSYSNGVVTGSVPSEQVQGYASSSINVGEHALSYAETEVSAGQTGGVRFALSQKTAFVKVSVSTAEYTAYTLTGIRMTCEGAALSGDVSYDIATGAMSAVGTSDSVTLTVSNPSSLRYAQDLYFTALPCDLTGREVQIDVFVTSGSISTTFPMTVDGGKLEEGCLTVIGMDIDDPALMGWYDGGAEDSRDYLDLSYAYGPQNTYYIEQPVSGPGHISIDVRARGDFSKVTKPKYYGLICASDRSSSERADNFDSCAGQKLLYLPDGSDEHQDVPTNVVNDDCTIDVYCYGQSEGNSDGNWGTVGIYDEWYNLLWSYMICKYYPGDEPASVDYGDGWVLLDRALGAPYSNARAAEEGTFKSPSAAYFQWGRKDPFPWVQESFYDAVYGARPTIEETIANPTRQYSDETNWLGDDRSRNDLWGGLATTGYDAANLSSQHGFKTIFDPCPEGYRVMDPYILKSLFNEDCDRWEYPNGNAQQSNSNINASSPFYNDGQSVWVLKLADGSDDYWPFFGYIWNDDPDLTVAELSPSCRNTDMGIWSCFNGSSNLHNALAIRVSYYDGDAYLNRDKIGKRFGFTVRCQKEE